MKKRLALSLAESAMMIALATILSFLKLVDLPYGGSITLASMIPLVIIAYRNGVLWGMFTGLVHGVIQMLLNTSVFSYVTGAASVTAVIVLDYLLAFALIGLAGLFRHIKDEKYALALGSLAACLLRYLCHVVSGCTVWAGLSIPTADAALYSFIYNATYMIPETIVTVIVAYFLGSVLDFASPRLTRIKSQTGRSRISAVCAGACVCAALIYDVTSVFATLQNSETGGFDITGVANVNWILFALVTAGGALAAAAILLISGFVRKRKQ